MACIERPFGEPAASTGIFGTGMDDLPAAARRLPRADPRTPVPTIDRFNAVPRPSQKKSGFGARGQPIDLVGDVTPGHEYKITITWAGRLRWIPALGGGDAMCHPSGKRRRSTRRLADCRQVWF
jgi:hypothetical protein